MMQSQEQQFDVNTALNASLQAAYDVLQVHKLETHIKKIEIKTITVNSVNKI